MRWGVVAMCTCVAVFGITSAVAGFAAEATRIKPSEVLIKKHSCVYPSSPAVELGILAGCCAIITRMLLMMLDNKCCRPSGYAFIIVYDIMSWVNSVAAMSLLFGGAALYYREGAKRDYFGRITSCYVAEPGIMAAGGVFSLFSMIFGILNYVSICLARDSTDPMV